MIGFSGPHDLDFYQIGLIVKIGIDVGFNVDDLIDEIVRIKNGERLAIKKERLLISRQLLSPFQQALSRQRIQQRLSVFGMSIQKVIERGNHVCGRPLFKMMVQKLHLIHRRQWISN